MADKLKIEQVRDDVSKAYAKAVTTGSGCCGGGATEVKGAVALLAGYSDEELRTLPQDAASNAFGCGNPVAMSEIGEGEVVLDLGSGAGIDILLAARKVGPTGKVIGVDMTDEMLARARTNIESAGLSERVEVRKGIIEEMPVEDGSVDWVISNCVINLSPEKPRVFAEIARVLKPGGRMLVSDIVAEDLPEWVRESSELYSSCVSGAIGEQEYIAGLQAAGLTDVEVRARLVYDSSQLKAFVADDVAPLEQSCCAGSCCAPEGKEQIEEGLQQVEGKIWSAKFFARKA
jgi:arsenite methyltransferase